MNPFLSINKVIMADLDTADAGYLGQLADSHPDVGTAVFCSGMEEGSQEHQLLRQILSAVGLEAAGSYLLIDKSSRASVRLRHLQRSFPSIERVILFDVDPAACGLQVNLPPYRVVSIGRYTVLRSAGLGQLAARKDHKQALWKALKEMYKV